MDYFPFCYISTIQCKERSVRKKKHWSEYEDEYQKYKHYLKSEEFDKVRQATFERDGFHCMVCGRTIDETVLVPHHNTYDHLYNELDHLDCMVTLCKNDHCCIHRNKANWVRFKQPKKEN